MHNELSVQTNGTIFYKSVQLLAYSDDTDIMATSRPSLKQAILALEGAARRMELRINQEKTKCMITIRMKSKVKI
jgi:hypothetical protein